MELMAKMRVNDGYDWLMIVVKLKEAEGSIAYFPSFSAKLSRWEPAISSWLNSSW